MQLWEADRGAKGPVLVEQGKYPFLVQFSPDGRFLVTAAAGESPRLWDVEGGRERSLTPPLDAGVSAAWFSPDGKRLLGFGNDGAVRVWHPDTGMEIATFRDPWLTSLSTPDGRRLFRVELPTIETLDLWAPGESPLARP
jgi:WD40 repeat protein